MPDPENESCAAADIAFGTNGLVYVADGYCNARVVVYDPVGRKVGEWGRPGTGPGEFNLPHGIAVSPEGNVYVADRLDLFAKDRRSIEALGRPAGSALQVHHCLQTSPILSVSRAARHLSLSAPTIRKSIGHLVDLGILEETTGKRRDRLFAYRSYIDILAQGTEPIR